MRPIPRRSVSAIIVLGMAGAACKARLDEAALESATSPRDAHPTTVKAADWTHGHEGELGCACETSGAQWQLVRYHYRNEATTRVLIGGATDLASCVKSKFAPVKLATGGVEFQDPLEQTLETIAAGRNCRMAY